MNAIKQILFMFFIAILTGSVSQCSTAQKLQREAPIEFGDAYAQNWVAGTAGGGSGINVFIPVKDNYMKLDTMFFRGQKAKVEFLESKKVYVGRFKTALNQQNDIILSSDLVEESKNKLPIPKEKMPFEFKDDECVLSYQNNNQTLYYKISNIEMRPPVHYPGAPPNGQ